MSVKPHHHSNFHGGTYRQGYAYEYRDDIGTSEVVTSWMTDEDYERVQAAIIRKRRLYHGMVCDNPNFQSEKEKTRDDQPFLDMRLFY